MAVLGSFVLTCSGDYPTVSGSKFCRNPVSYYLDTFDLTDFGLGISFQLFGKIHNFDP
jgi:hypothetical protein